MGASCPGISACHAPAGAASALCVYRRVAIPIIVLFFSLQRFFTKKLGLTIGSIKD